MCNAKAQTITAFTVSPPNPTTADTVTIYIQCDFTASGCAGQSFYQGVSGNQINGGGLHCLGPAATPCTDFDTVIVPPLAAGQYAFVFLLTTGISAGCIPNIIPIDIDSVQFTVSNITVINELNNNDPFHIIPNPSRGNFIVKQNAGQKSLLEIYTMEGSLIKSVRLTGSETVVEGSFSAGVYSVMLQCEYKKYFSKLAVIK